MSSSESTIGFANLQGAAGMTARGTETLQRMVSECDVLGLAEVLVCCGTRTARINPRYMAPLDVIAGGNKVRFFLPLCTSNASPLRPKWTRLSQRIRTSPLSIRSASWGLGMIAQRALLPLFSIPALPQSKAQIVGGYLGAGSTEYSPLLYRGDRNHEQRGVLFARLPLGQQSLIVCVTHLTTLLNEQRSARNLICKDAQRIRAFQIREIIGAIQYLQRHLLSHEGILPHVIIAGDFNCQPDAREVQLFRQRGIRCVFDDYPWKELPPNSEGQICTDHVWFSRGLHLRHFRMSKIGRSDHQGIVATFKEKMPTA